MVTQEPSVERKSSGIQDVLLVTVLHEGQTDRWTTIEADCGDGQERNWDISGGKYTPVKGWVLESCRTETQS